MDIYQLATILSDTFENFREEAEEKLNEIHKLPGFMPLLLQVVMSNELQIPIRQSGGIYLKNMIGKYWKDRDPSELVDGVGVFVISEQDKATIRENIVEAVIHAPELIRIQLTVCIGWIVWHDFPEKWPEVVDKVNGFLSESSQAAWQGALLILYKIFKKYQFKKPEECEILHRIMQILQPQLNKLSTFLRNDPSQLSVEIQEQICKIFSAFVQMSSREHGESKWGKKIIFADIVEGKLSPICTIRLTLCNESASVEQITRMVEEEVGRPVMLLDNKGLRIIPSESTKGSFWQRRKKVYAIPYQNADALAGKRKLSAGQAAKSSSGVESALVELKKMRENLTKLQLPVPSADKAVCDFLVKVFRCKICFEVATLPAAACSNCENVIGCIPCVERWREAKNACPLCRSHGGYSTVPMLREIQQVLNTYMESTAQSPC